MKKLLKGCTILLGAGMGLLLLAGFILYAIGDSYRRGRDCPRRTHCDDLVVYLLSWGRSERQTR